MEMKKLKKTLFNASLPFMVYYGGVLLVFLLYSFVNWDLSFINNFKGVFSGEIFRTLVVFSLIIAIYTWVTYWELTPFENDDLD